MKRTEIKRYTALSATGPGLRQTALARTGALKPGTKRLRQSRSTDKPTRDQAARWERMRERGCVCCHLALLLGYKPITGMRLEHHHLTDCGRRIGHDHTIELCRFHHQGDMFPMIEAGYKANALVYGPSYGREPARWHEVYGSDAAMLEFQNALLGDCTV